jgi:hypothetical protein
MTHDQALTAIGCTQLCERLATPREDARFLNGIAVIHYTPRSTRVVTHERSDLFPDLRSYMALYMAVYVHISKRAGVGAVLYHANDLPLTAWLDCNTTPMHIDYFLSTGNTRVSR